MLRENISSHVLLFLCYFASCVDFFVNAAVAKGTHKVHCSENLMHVEIVIPEGISKSPSTGPKIFLEGLKDYPDERCHPSITNNLAEFRLSLSNFYECGVTRMINQLTGKKVYYHKIIIETENSKEIVSVKCITNAPTPYNPMMNASSQVQEQFHHGVVKRDVLPAGFQEPEDLEITTSLTERAPEPRLSIGVSQNGKKVTGDLTVTPGTPLTMEIALDRESAPVYGLGVNYLEVTDTRALSETIIFKGCTVDPYLFENFNTLDGDLLSAKFKAFKFPDSSYVQFRATVNVCRDKCLGTKCSNNQIGYGRRKRDVSPRPTPTLADTNKVFEISLAMFIKINDIEGANQNELMQLEEKLRELKLTNQRLARNSRGSFGENVKSLEQIPPSEEAFVLDEKDLNLAAVVNGAYSESWPFSFLLSLLCLFSLRFMF